MHSMHSTGKLPPSAGNEVDALLESLAHPLRDDIARVRQLVLEAHGKVTEAVRWNAPAFLAGRQLFAFIDVEKTDAVHLVLLAKPQKLSGPLEVPGRAAALVAWRSEDEAVVVIDPARLRAQRDSVAALVRAWVAQLNAEGQ